MALYLDEGLAFGLVRAPVRLLALAAAVLDLMAGSALLELIGGSTAVAAVRVAVKSINNHHVGVFFHEAAAGWYGLASYQPPPLPFNLRAIQRHRDCGM